jgi:hypothetical protein
MRLATWLLNFLPPAIVIWFVHSMSLGKIFGSLGFGAGIGLAIIFLSFLYWQEKVGEVIIWNFLLSGFFFLSYYLPRFNALDPKGFYFWFSMFLFMIPFMQAVLVMFLIQALLMVKPGSDFFEPSKPVIDLYFRPAVYIGLMGAIILCLSLTHTGAAKFSTIFAGAQLLSWFIIWFALYVLGRPLQVDFGAVGDYVARAIKAKGLKLRIRQDTIISAFLTFLLICTFFEAFRGSWRLWGLTALWLIFLVACLWRVWGFAFQPGQGPGWRYVEAAGGFLEHIRTKIRRAEVKKDSAISLFLRSHTTFLSISLILVLTIVLIFFKITPILFIILLFGLALVINYVIKETLKTQGIIIEDRLPLTVGMTFIMMAVAMFSLLYLIFFIIRQIIFG